MRSTLRPALGHGNVRSPQIAAARPSISRTRRGVSLVEVLVVLGIIGLLLSLLGPAVQNSRELARAASCRNNLHQLALAAHEHESSHQTFPYTSTRYGDPGPPERTYCSRSPHREMMAFLDVTLFRKLDRDDISDPGWISTPPAFVSTASRALQAKTVPVFACPSDRVCAGATSYRANLGTSVHVLTFRKDQETPKPHGAFENGRAVATSEFLDGLSHTALFSERVLGDYNPARYEPFRDFYSLDLNVTNTREMARLCQANATPAPRSEYSFAGGTWQMGGSLNTWYNHILTPNSVVPDCGEGACCTDGGRMIVTARSLHHGGVNVALGDGAIRFVSNSVDLSVWMSMGTRNGSEPTSE